MSIEEKQCHLSFIQNIIGRMAGNSFLLRGWSITLFAAIFTLSAKDSDSRLVVISYFSAIFFWLLDVYYIRQEKLFRQLYEEVAENRFPSDRYSLNTASVNHLVPPASKIFLAKNTIVFHLPVLAIITTIMIYFLITS